MYVFKKLIAPLLFPAALCVEVLLVGLVLLWLTKRQKAGKIVATVGAAMVMLFTSTPFSKLVLGPLEYRHRAQALRGDPPDSLPQVRWVVVLGGGHSTDPRLPITSQMSPYALARVAEGVRLYRKLDRATLVFSGGTGRERRSDANVMADVALALGVEPKDIALERNSRDTKDQARQIGRIVGGDPFFLVTVASHMPGAMGLFRKQGLRPIAAPTAFRVKRYVGLTRNMFYPGAGALQSCERAFYEYLGIGWGKLRGQI